MWVGIAIALTAIAGIALGLCYRSKDLDWRPIFVVLVGNFLIVSTASLVHFVWPARRVMLTGNASIFHEDGQSLATLFIAFSLLFSMIEVLLIWIAVSGFRILKSHVAGE